MSFAVWFKSFAFRSKSFAVWFKSFAVCSKSFAVCSKSFAVCSKSFAVCSKSFAVCSKSFAVCSKSFAVRSKSFAVRSKSFAVRSKSFAVRSQPRLIIRAVVQVYRREQPSPQFSIGTVEGRRKANLLNFKKTGNSFVPNAGGSGKIGKQFVQTDLGFWDSYKRTKSLSSTKSKGLKGY